MGRKNLHSMKSLVKRLMFLALIVLGAAGVWAQTPTRILEDIPVNWTVTADGNTVTVTPYHLGSPLGSAEVPEGAEVVLTPTGPDKPRVKDVELLTPKEIPLTFEAMVDNATVTFTKALTLPNLSIEYSKNGDEWTAYSEPITLNIGEKVSFRGDNTTYATSYNNDSYSRFSCTNQCYVYGNIMSLINSDTNDYATNKTLEGAYAFCKLFFSNNNIYSHASKELILPATTLSADCYENMFYQCSNLTKAPVLPATTLTDHCYFGMFMYCTGITTAPELPATTLASSCYYQMFAYTHISTTPELPATTLSTSCYKNMFQGCTYLTTATALPATTLASNCYSYMFTGCSNLTTAPALPATTLANGCYSRMFNGCTKLNSVTCLATNISATNCTLEWLDGVAATGTFYKPSSMTSWLIDNPSGIPEGWTAKPSETFLPLTFEAKEANATVTFTSTMATAPAIEYSKNGGAWTAYTEPINLADSGNKVSFRGTNAAYATGSYFSRFTCTGKCYSYGNVMSLIDSIDFATKETLTEPFALSKLFQNNSNLYSHPEKSLLLPATTLSENCYYFMFSGCSNLTTAPALPATTLATGCYLYMFQSCSSLTTAPELPATTLANNCYSSMFASCSSLTAAPELPATTLTNACYMEMFNGCSSLTAAPMLPATTLVDFCYFLMFLNCSSLNSVTCLATDITAEFCTTNWLKNVAATGTFNKPMSMNGWTINSSDGIPAGWTTIHVASFTSPQAIIKFTLKNKANDAAINATSLAFTDGTNTYTIKPASATSVIYVAIPGFSGQNIRLIATVGTTIYHYEEDNVTFDNGSNYEIEVKMTDFNTEAGTNPTLDLFSDIDVEGFIFTITRDDGVVDFNGHEMTTRVFIQNNTPGKTVTLQNGFISSPSDGIDGASGWDRFYYGTVRLVNMTIPGNIFTDGHAYIIDGGTFVNIENVTYKHSSSYPATVTIYGGYFLDLDTLKSDTWGWNNVKKGSYTLYGGYYKVDPSTHNNVTIASGYHVETVSGEYGWRVVPNSGLFSVSNTKQVYFSQGNLQAVCTSADNDGSTQESWSWQFAANQWDYVGSTAANTSINGNGSVSAAGTVDLFGWVGASSTWTGAAQYGISNSIATYNTNGYGNNAFEALKSDWGNTIGSGWRTLTSAEWTYVFSTRTSGSTVNGTADARYTHATINTDGTGVNGIILFPDGVTIANSEATSWGTINDNSAWGTQCTTAQWAALAAKGCVFLPASGYRQGASVSDAGSNSSYWSTSNISNVHYAYRVKFSSANLDPAIAGNRCLGYSVRLVRDAN